MTERRSWFAWSPSFLGVDQIDAESSPDGHRIFPHEWPRLFFLSSTVHPLLSAN